MRETSNGTPKAPDWIGRVTERCQCVGHLGNGKCPSRIIYLEQYTDRKEEKHRKTVIEKLLEHAKSLGW